MTELALLTKIAARMKRCRDSITNTFVCQPLFNIFLTFFTTLFSGQNIAGFPGLSAEIQENRFIIFVIFSRRQQFVFGYSVYVYTS
jgi:hypothetical protein